MTSTESNFKAWVDRLVQACLPLELQRKLLRMEPLTKDEAKRYVDVMVLVAESKQLAQGDKAKHAIDNLAKKIDRILGMSREQLKNERAILWYTSSGDSRYKPADGRASNYVRRVMVQYAQTLIEKDSTLSERSAALVVIKKFAGIEGAYTIEELDSFRRQINRQNPLS